MVEGILGIVVGVFLVTQAIACFISYIFRESPGKTLIALLLALAVAITYLVILYQL